MRKCFCYIVNFKKQVTNCTYNILPVIYKKNLKGYRQCVVISGWWNFSWFYYLLRVLLQFIFKISIVNMLLSFKFIYFTYFIFGCIGSSLLHRLFSSCGKRGLDSVAVRRLLIAVASLVAEQGLYVHRLQ